MIKKVLTFISLTIGCYLTALLWWKFWMYHGVVGPTPLLDAFISTDGEGSYTRVELEMFLNIYIPSLCLLVWFFRRTKVD